MCCSCSHLLTVLQIGLAWGKMKKRWDICHGTVEKDLVTYFIIHALRCFLKLTFFYSAYFPLSGDIWVGCFSTPYNRQQSVLLQGWGQISLEGREQTTLWQLVASHKCEEKNNPLQTAKMGPVVRKHWAAASALWSDWRESLKPRALQCSGVLRHLRSWALFSINGRDLTSEGGDKRSCWHKCALTGAAPTAVKELRSQKQYSKCHLQVWHKGLSLSVDLCNPKPRRGPPENVFLCAHKWVSPLCMSVISLPHLLVENLLGEGSRCHHQA